MDQYEDFYRNICDQIITKDDLDILAAEIDLIIASSFETKDKLRDVLNDKVRKKIGDIFQDGINRGVNLPVFLKKLQQKLESFKILNLYLAFDPTQKFINQVYSWVKINMGLEIVLDIQKDSSVVAGAVIVFQGIYKDFSLRSGLDNFFANRNNLKTLIKYE